MAARGAGPAVLLGLRDVAMPASGTGSAQAPAWATNKLGGAPDLPPALGAAPASAPPCGGCGAALLHVLQVSCPLEGSALHRALHVFACAAPACCGRAAGWRALRSQCECAPRARPAPQEQQERLAARDWCDEADDWGACDEFEPPELNHSGLLGVNEASNSCLPKEAECASQLQRLSLAEADPFCIHLPAGEERVMSSSAPTFKPYYIAVVDEEDYTGYVDTDHAHKLLKEYQQREGINLEELMSESFAGEGDREKYEKSKLRSRDQVFHKFMKRISACPEQILRYSWGGEPLFITCPPSDISRGVPACSNCGSNRVFEFQLMPALVSMLESDADLSIEFGTVLVYTCERSCWSVNQKNPLEEFIFIQEDPDQQLFK